MISAEEIRQRLGAYLLGEMPLDEFEDWFVPYSWNAHRRADEEARRLVFEIEGKLSEYSGGHIDEPALRKALSDLLNKRTVRV